MTIAATDKSQFSLSVTNRPNDKYTRVFVSDSCFQPSLIFVVKPRASQMFSSRAGSQPYPQIIDCTRKDCCGQTLQLIFFVASMANKKFYQQVMPNHVEEGKEILRFLAEEVSKIVIKLFFFFLTDKGTKISQSVCPK